MPTFKVTEILGNRPWEKDGEVKAIYWDFRADGVEKVCNIGRKPGNDLKVGDQFDATAEEDRGKLKLKTQNGYGGGGGGGKSFKADPTKNAAIAMECAIKAALHYSEVQLAREKLPDDFNYTQLEKPAWFFYGLVLQAMEGAK